MELGLLQGSLQHPVVVFAASKETRKTDTIDIALFSVVISFYSENYYNIIYQNKVPDPVPLPLLEISRENCMLCNFNLYFV